VRSFGDDAGNEKNAGLFDLREKWALRIYIGAYMKAKPAIRQTCSKRRF
jgi:hypothetical protein